MSTLSNLCVYLIDDDESFCLAMSKALRRRGFKVKLIHQSPHAVRALLDAPPNTVAVLDLKMPQLSGLDVLRQTMGRNLPVLMLTGHGGVPDAVQAMRAGAYTFLTKPVDADDLIPLLIQAAQHHQNQQSTLIGPSSALNHLRGLIQHLAPAQEPVLITGETGTGKEVVARALHKQSQRKNEPFIAVNMACLPSELIASELFGHQKGSFTGAHANKVGLFEKVGRGTLFLDEVAELPFEHQAKLLRVIELSSFRPVGQTEPLPFEGRLITATHRNLLKEVEEGRFRDDLFYRLQVLPLHLPPLRQRIEDIIPIFKDWFSRITQSSILLTPEAVQTLNHHPWPGNVREVVNLCRRLAIFHPQGGTLDQTQIQQMLQAHPFHFSTPALNPSLNINAISSTTYSSVSPISSPSTPLTQPKTSSSSHVYVGSDLSLEELEKMHITALLDKYTNVSQVARILKVNRRTLQRKLKAWGMSESDS